MRRKLNSSYCVRLKLSVFVVTMVMIFPTVSKASNGYFAYGYGARSKGMAGAGSALPQDAVAAAVNPAGMVFVGNRLDLELEAFSPQREYNVSGTPTLAAGAFPLNNGTVKSGSNFFAIPTIGWNYKIDDKQSVGISIFGNGGMNTSYPDFYSRTCPVGRTGTFCAGSTGIDLEQAFISPSYAHSFANKQFSLGIAPIIALQTFKAYGLNSFAAFSSDPSNLSDKGRDFSYGAGVRVGGLVELLPSLHLGLSYKSRVFMSRFHNYAGLFAEQGSFDIPQSVNAGLAWQINNQFTTALDVEYINYSSIKAVGNSLLPNLQTAQLGNNQGAGFGWRDMTIVKLGTQWKQNENWTWRAGVSYGEQPIPKSQVLFNVLAPGVQEWHLTTGFSHALTSKDDLSFAFMFSPTKSVSGANPLSPSQTIDLKMYQFSFQLAWSRQF